MLAKLISFTANLFASILANLITKFFADKD